jgi:TRAP-type C4-dicarboxylate transport system permease small subunit
MAGIARLLRRFAEHVMVGLMAAMFFAFIVQIASRYVFNAPVAWAYEVILVTWLWAVFWGCAFLLGDADHVKFDVIYNAAGARARRAMALLAAMGLAAGLAVSAPATWDWIEFKAIRSTDILGIRFDLLFGVYMLFLVASIGRYAWRAWRLARGVDLAALERDVQA